MFNLRTASANRKNSSLCGWLLNVTAGWKLSKKEVRNQLTLPLLTLCHSLPELTWQLSDICLLSIFQCRKKTKIWEKHSKKKQQQQHPGNSLPCEPGPLHFEIYSFQIYQPPVPDTNYQHFKSRIWHRFMISIIWWDWRTNLLCCKALTGHATQWATTGTNHNPVTSTLAFTNLRAWAWLWAARMVNKSWVVLGIVRWGNWQNECSLTSWRFCLDLQMSWPFSWAQNPACEGPPGCRKAASAS